VTSLIKCSISDINPTLSITVQKRHSGKTWICSSSV